MVDDGVRQQVSGVEFGVIVVNVRSAVTFAAALLDDHSQLGSAPQRASAWCVEMLRQITPRGRCAQVARCEERRAVSVVEASPSRSNGADRNAMASRL
jgi:hypothetical protein